MNDATAPQTSASSLSRRSLVRGAAWSVPALALGAGPALATGGSTGCPTRLINVPWADTYYAYSRWGDSNSYVAGVLYPTRGDGNGYAEFTGATPKSGYGNLHRGQPTPFPPDYTDCSGACSVAGQKVTIIVEHLDGDATYSPTPKTYNDVPGAKPEGNAWPYLITQQPDRGTCYEVTKYSKLKPQPGSLGNEYSGVLGGGLADDSCMSWCWEICMKKPTCSPNDGAGAIEWQVFFPPHYAPAGKISNPNFRITLLSPWGKIVWTR